MPFRERCSLVSFFPHFISAPLLFYIFGAKNPQSKGSKTMGTVRVQDVWLADAGFIVLGQGFDFGFRPSCCRTFKPISLFVSIMVCLKQTCVSYLDVLVLSSDGNGRAVSHSNSRHLFVFTAVILM